MPRSSFSLALAAITLSASIVVAQDRFGDATDVVVVEVPVQVLRDGKPVRGLTKDDFEVLDGRKEVDIIAFDVIDLTISEPGSDDWEPQTVPAAGRRHFLLFFDLSFSNPASIVKAREAAKSLVRTSMHPSDLIGVATYSASEGVRFPLGFTSDRRQVVVAIDTLGLPQMVETVRDPLGIILADNEGLREVEIFGQDAGGGNAAGIDAEAEIREVLERIERDEQAATSRNEILALSSAMGGLADALNSIDGRKHVLFLSEGFDSTVVVGSARGATFEEQRRIQQVNEAAASGRVWEVQSDERFGNTQTQNQLTQMLDEFVRADATIEAIDIGGLRDASNTRNEDGLFLMANETGGQFVSNFNDLGEAIGTVLERTSVTYLLAFSPREVRYDGKFREIKVKLTDGGRGTRVVHRPGYFDPQPMSAMSGIERQLSAANAIMAGRAGGAVSTAAIAGAFPHDGDVSYVPVLVEADGRSLIGKLKGKVLPTEVFAYAIDSSGEVRDYFSQTLGLDLAKARAALEQTGFKFWGNLELPPGDYEIKVLVRNAETGDSGLSIAAVTVPGNEAGMSLLPPFLPEPGGKWLLAREQGVDPSTYSYPYMLGDQAFIPAARPALGGSGAQTVSLVGYRLGGESIAARAELIDASGNSIEGVAFQLTGRFAGRDGLEQLVGDLSLESIPAGSYELRMSVRDMESGATVSSSVPVDVAL